MTGVSLDLLVPVFFRLLLDDCINPLLAVRDLLVAGI